MYFGSKSFCRYILWKTTDVNLNLNFLLAFWCSFARYHNCGWKLSLLSKISDVVVWILAFLNLIGPYWECSYDHTKNYKMFFVIWKKIVFCDWEQIPEAAAQEAIVVRLLISYSTNHQRHAGHCWGNKEELINDVLLKTPTHGHTTVDRAAKTYFHQFCVYTGYRLEGLRSAMPDRE